MDRARAPAMLVLSMAIIICSKTCFGWKSTGPPDLSNNREGGHEKTHQRERTIMSTQMKQSNDQLIFRKTNAQKGRTISITPENSSMKHLVYGRIILDSEVPSVSFSTGKLESGLICLSGECTITCDGVTNRIEQYDSIYLPRDSKIEVATDSSVDLVECSAE